MGAANTALSDSQLAEVLALHKQGDDQTLAPVQNDEPESVAERIFPLESTRALGQDGDSGDIEDHNNSDDVETHQDRKRKTHLPRQTLIRE